MKYKPEEVIEFFENTQEMIRASEKLARLNEESCKENKTYDCGLPYIALATIILFFYELLLDC